MRRQVRAALAFSSVVLRSLSRDRRALFFMLVLPVVVIVIIGTTFGGQGSIALGVVGHDDSALADVIGARLATAAGIRVTVYADENALDGALRRRRVDAGLVIPSGFGAQVAAGGPGTLQFVTGPASTASVTMRLAVKGVVDEAGARLGAAVFATEQTGRALDRTLSTADVVAAQGGVRVVTIDVGGGRSSHLSDFALTAPQNLVLFTFINALASATFLVGARRDGVLRRALATRTGLGTVLTGLTVGWFALALAQAMIIVVVGRIAFDVQWGNTVATALIVAL